jgi:hypothetical protein
VDKNRDPPRSGGWIFMFPDANYLPAGLFE